MSNQAILIDNAPPPPTFKERFLGYLAWFGAGISIILTLTLIKYLLPDLWNMFIKGPKQ